MSGNEETEENYRLMARLDAIEYLLCEMIAAFLIASGRQNTVDAIRERVRTLIQQKGFPGVDPTKSDVYSGELEDAVSALFRRLKSHTMGPRL